MSRDPTRAWIERRVTHPVISYDWGANTLPDDWQPDPSHSGILLPPSATKSGLIDEWRKVKDKIKRRRSRSSTDSELHGACEEALKLVDIVTKAGECGAISGDWRPSHEILRDVADIYEARVGHINPLVQAVVREAMDEVMAEERLGK